MPSRTSAIWASRMVSTGRVADPGASGIRKLGDAAVAADDLFVGAAAVTTDSGVVTGAVWLL